jgi:FAD/FMN-containing dehydrogenase
MNDQTVTHFRQSFRGALIARDDADYDEARKLYNGMIDKHPLMIARCADVADVIATVNFARDNQLLLAVRGGGHNGPGLGMCDDGVVIDLSTMKGVRVDPAKRTVRVLPGCTQGDVEHAGHAFGLAVPSGIVSTTGMGGLTLGGGTGYLTRQYGLTVDNLIEADVVLADGRFVTASAANNSDLFWALRGGGGNFGVVTSFLFQGRPVSTIYGGPIFWDHKHARAIMQRYRDFLPGAPEALGLFVGLKAVPSGAPFPPEAWGKRACALFACYNGSSEDGERALTPILKALPPPLFNWIGTMPFPALQSLFDPLLPKGLQWYWKGDFVKSLPDAAIDAHIEHSAKAPGVLSLTHLYPIDAAAHRVGENETAWSARDATWSMVIAAVDPSPEKAGALKQWAKAYWNAVHPFNQSGGYVNFMMDDEGDARVRASYGGNYERLVAIKGRYDPANLFRVNQNIRPFTRDHAGRPAA